MANMSYCRFHNTLGDLRDCYEALSNADGPDLFADLSEPEAKAARSLLKLCARMADDFEDEAK